MVRLPEPSPTGMPSAARPEDTEAATWWLRIAPSAETPIDPPIERKNATSELAAPMSDCAVLFCTARTRFCMVAPRPRPRTAMNTPTRARLVLSSIVDRRLSPTITRIMPPTRNFFQRPVSLMIRPVVMLETSRPPTIAIDIRPACVGDIPRASWKYCDRYTVDPNIATPISTDAAVASDVVRSRKRRIGMIGSRATLIST